MRNRGPEAAPEAPPITAEPDPATDGGPDSPAGRLLGPSASFDAFYADQYALAVRLALSLTGRMSVAEEHVQDAFVSAHNSWDRVSTFDRPDLWLRRVLVNRCLSGWRRLRTERRLIERLTREGQPPGLSTADYAVDTERDAALWQAVRSLPRRQAQVIALRYVEELSVREIGEVLGCSEDTIRTHERRARAALATTLSLPIEQEDAR